jgi:hypothetical protein
VKQRLVAVEEQQAAGAVAGHLMGDLAADRPSRPSDEHGGASEVVADPLDVHGRGPPAQEVGQVEVAHVLEHPGARVGGRSEHLHLRPGAEGAIDDRLRLLPVGVGEGDEDPVDRVPATEVLEVGDASKHPDAAQRSAMQEGVVVDEPNNLNVAARVGVRDLVGQGGPRAPRADDERPHRLGGPGSLSLEGKEAGLKAHATAADEYEQRRHRWGRE